MKDERQEEEEKALLAEREEKRKEDEKRDVLADLGALQKEVDALRESFADSAPAEEVVSPAGQTPVPGSGAEKIMEEIRVHMDEKEVVGSC